MPLGLRRLQYRRTRSALSAVLCGGSQRQHVAPTPDLHRATDTRALQQATMTVNVPWSTLRPNPRDQRERAAANAGVPGGGDSRPLTKEGEQEIAWDVTDFGKRMAFGGIVGGVTGITFGAMDGHRAIRDDGTGKFPTRALKTKEFMRLTALSGTIFTGFFCTYQGVKYAAKLARKEDDFWNVLIASAGSFAPMLAIPAMRSRYPYAAILIAMDTLNNHVL